MINFIIENNIAAIEEKIIALFSFLKSCTGIYKITSPMGINIFFITTKSSAIRPNKKAFIKRKIKNIINISKGFASNFLKSFLVTIKGKAINKIPNNKFGKALI